MIYKNNVLGESISALGFGAMRLPLTAGGKGSDIDQNAFDAMVDYAIAHGLNYFDTAYPYHDYMSEVAVGNSLSRYDRSSFLLADKFPGHMLRSEYDVDGIFEKQLRKCQVDYFDFYLLHNVSNGSLYTYLDDNHKIVERVYEFKKQGKIHHFGMSTHGDVEGLKKFFDKHGDKIEFVQMQLNYIDWTLQKAEEVYTFLTDNKIPVWVMEPVRGGKLATLDDYSSNALKEYRKDEKAPGWAFRFLQGLDNVKVILSGMSDMNQMVDNCETFEERIPATEDEKKILFAYAERLKNSVPCTGCRYCCEGCPMQIDIPMLISCYNDSKLYPSVNNSLRLRTIPEGRLPENCIGCGQCTSVCPQGIDIPDLMIKMTELFSTIPTWEEFSAKRDEMEKQLE